MLAGHAAMLNNIPLLAYTSTVVVLAFSPKARALNPSVSTRSGESFVADFISSGRQYSSMIQRTPTEQQGETLFDMENKSFEVHTYRMQKQIPTSCSIQ